MSVLKAVVGSGASEREVAAEIVKHWRMQSAAALGAQEGEDGRGQGGKQD